MLWKKSGLEHVLLDSTTIKNSFRFNLFRKISQNKTKKFPCRSKKSVFLKLLHLLIISNRCLRNFQSPAVMSLITEKDVHGFSAVHYAAKKGDIKVWIEKSACLTAAGLAQLLERWSTRAKGLGFVNDNRSNSFFKENCLYIDRHP